MFAVACNFLIFFFFNDTATTEIYTLSLHDALPIFRQWMHCPTSWMQYGMTDDAVLMKVDAVSVQCLQCPRIVWECGCSRQDRKSTRLNSSHANISYAVFCLKKKKTNRTLRHSIYIV